MLLAFILLGFFAICGGSEAAAQTNTAQYYGEKIIESRNIEVAISDTATPPLNGWKPISLRELSENNGVAEGRKPPKYVWTKFHFDRSQLGRHDLAFMVDLPRLGIKVELNGNDIYEYYTISNYQTNSWNSPVYFRLPNKFLNARDNEIILRMEINSTFGTNGGYLRVGPEATIAKLYDFMNLADNLFPRSITNIMLFLSFCLLLLWLARPKDYEFLWLAMTGLLWSARNWRYFIQTPPLEAKYFLTISNLLIYLFLICLLGFAGYFVGLRHFKPYIKIVAAACIGSFLLHFIVQFTYGDVRGLYLLALSISFFSTLYICFESAKSLTTEKAMIIFPLFVLLGLSFHDIGVVALDWPGVAFSLQPYGSIFLFFTFTFALGGRIIHAFDNLENMNIILDNEVKAATDKLKASEKAKHELELSLAIENERERLMREIHDGIGSSLMTTLAVTKSQDAKSPAVPALQRAIADLRIAVDSLEPIQGNVSTLLASLRYRLERDLNEAGIKFIWRVDEVPAIEWLDAVSALHILRILQEAISNIIAHAKAQNITVTCQEAHNSEKPGIIIGLEDDGKGIRRAEHSKGRGIANMKARAAAIAAKLEIVSMPRKGTKLSLWLPLHQANSANPSK